MSAAPNADNYLTHSHGIASWIFTLDHKRIGVMYLVSVLAAFLLGGVVAMLIRLQLLKPEGLLIHGSDDLVNPTANTPLMAGEISGSQTCIVGGARHGYFEEYRTQSSRVVLEFLARHRIR